MSFEANHSEVEIFACVSHLLKFVAYGSQVTEVTPKDRLLTHTKILLPEMVRLPPKARCVHEESRGLAGHWLLSTDGERFCLFCKQKQKSSGSGSVALCPEDRLTLPGCEATAPCPPRGLDVRHGVYPVAAEWPTQCCFWSFSVDSGDTECPSTPGHFLLLSYCFGDQQDGQEEASLHGRNNV
ncbi:Ubiquitin Carboxyl-Terminal Hydrolase 45 [Manis pentadactyla]|nr:Ubiquitin Carboxyl-Terminal Hydrolase 45 [Manis pentadactyla]